MTPDNDIDTRAEALDATDDPGMLEPWTHRIWRCGGCGREVLIPKGQAGAQIDHANRLFCRCEDAGVRLTPVGGVDGRVRL